MLAFFRFIKFYNEGEITMVSVRKRGKVYEYRFEIATVEGTRKWITKSGVPTPNIEPFNPGTFVEALNKNGGFDERGNLYYGPISNVVPNFKYVGNVNLRGKSRSEKLALITQYVNAGYFVTEEVKGATPGNQHWVAVTGVNGNNFSMVDPASNQTDMWSAYEWSKSSQFNYFKAE